ncbi:MAG: cytochrome b/b6 domain-containing protein, partial [Anaerolineae bacterium]|nr:cytochrome b/b6 domain-containing protein [Anaerolineae bacterium]
WVNPDTGALEPWDWAESGVVEMNCFLCHTPEPNNGARVEALQAGEFGWANSATLLGTGLIEQDSAGEWVWNSDAFAEDGTLLDEYVTVRDPDNNNCGQCHGLVHVDPQTPLILNECTPAQWSTITTGQVFSPQRLAESGANVADKDEMSRSYDVHAERVVSCTDCHYSLNNPVYYQASPGSQPDHLVFDPRRIDLGEYLFRPLHEFAKGQSSQSLLAPEYNNTLRRCESCHDAASSHTWLPYQERHTTALACETCHVPMMYAPARQYNDWTVLQADGGPQSVCRGVDLAGGRTLGTALITGYEPVLLPRLNVDGTTQLAPHNLVTSWYWVYGDPARPVPYRDLEAAWLDGEGYAAEVMAAFDVNGNNQLDTDELLLDSMEKQEFIARRLRAQGLDNPRVMGEVRPYAINHNVTHGEWATRECTACHSVGSRLDSSLVLADRVPMGEMPVLVSSPATTLSGEIRVDDDGRLLYEPQHDTEVINLYIFGVDSVLWIDALGALMFLGTAVVITGHSGLRYLAARRRTPHEAELSREYMYSLYERQWHWLQTATILGLLFTGLVIHRPHIFGMFSFPFVVQVHNVLAALLVINAFLAAFYHFASGEIRQFLPRPYGFFDQAFAQAKYYLQGIFKGAEHPFRKSAQRKMNPLQQITYLAILNVLLPLQIITGILMWGAQTWPEVANALGGLPVLAPFHTLIAWLFATFIVAHVYLTTTVGRQPTDGIKAMIVGWEEVEVEPESAE